MLAQVQYAFVAGVLLCVLLIPVNRWLAQRIGAASSKMMSCKDARIQTMSELLRGIRAVKMLCWEGVFLQKVSEHPHSVRT